MQALLLDGPGNRTWSRAALAWKGWTTGQDPHRRDSSCRIRIDLGEAPFKGKACFFDSRVMPLSRYSSKRNSSSRYKTMVIAVVVRGRDLHSATKDEREPAV